MLVLIKYRSWFQGSQILLRLAVVDVQELVGSRSNFGKGCNDSLVDKEGYVSDLHHELWAKGIAHAGHGHYYRELGKLGGQRYPSTFHALLSCIVPAVYFMAHLEQNQAVLPAFPEWSCEYP